MTGSAGRLSLTLVLAASIALGAVAAQGPPPPPPAPSGMIGPPAAAALPPGTGAISGVVVDVTTRQPIASAIVALGPPRQVQQERQLTDAKGRFIFRDVAKFDGYTLTAQKPGYFDGVYGGPAARQSKSVAVADPISLFEARPNQPANSDSRAGFQCYRFD